MVQALVCPSLFSHPPKDEPAGVLRPLDQQPQLQLVSKLSSAWSRLGGRMRGKTTVPHDGKRCRITTQCPSPFTILRTFQRFSQTNTRNLQRGTCTEGVRIRARRTQPEQRIVLSIYRASRMSSPPRTPLACTGWVTHILCIPLAGSKILRVSTTGRTLTQVAWLHWT